MKKVRDAWIQEINVAASVAEKLLRAIEDVEKTITSLSEKRAAKPIFKRLYAFLIEVLNVYIRSTKPETLTIIKTILVVNLIVYTAVFAKPR